jgi:hypothetical protein
MNVSGQTFGTKRPNILTNGTLPFTGKLCRFLPKGLPQVLENTKYIASGGMLC